MIKKPSLLARSSFTLIPDDTSAKALSLVIVVSVFLMSLVIYGVFCANRVTQGWQQDLSGHLLVQITPDDSVDIVRVAARVEKTLHDLEGVKDTRALSKNEIQDLISTWLDVSVLPDNLPYPKIYEVALDDDTPDAVATIKNEMAKISDAVVVSDHQLWLNHLSRFIGRLKFTGIFVFLLVAATSISVVILSTQTVLAAHQDIIRILHHIGARDRFIARHISRTFIRKSLLAGLIGTALAAVFILSLSLSARGLSFTLDWNATLSPLFYLSLLVLPLLTTIVVMAVAMGTVLHKLSSFNATGS